MFAEKLDERGLTSHFANGEWKLKVLVIARGNKRHRLHRLVFQDSKVGVAVI